MGREAKCRCTWGAETAECKVLLEGQELVLRLGIKRRVPLTALADVSVQADNLVFHVGSDHVELNLGAEAAERWARAIATPRPTLASRLGLSKTTRLRVLGHFGDGALSEELQAAIAEGQVPVKGPADLILICVHTPAELESNLASLKCSAPLWILYPKGAGSGISEAEVRERLRSYGYTDTKVTSVSAKLTALRFNQRKEQVACVPN